MNRMNTTLLIILLGTCYACEKVEVQEQVPSPPPPGDPRNMAPVAVFAIDKDTIMLPTESIVELDASQSFDRDGNIASYSFRKISGPGYVDAYQPVAAKSSYQLLDTGIYYFEVTVTDNGGAYGKDTTQITALYEKGCSRSTYISLTFNPITELRDSIYSLPVAGRSGNKLFFTSGIKLSNNGQSQEYDRKVYWYDFETGIWESGKLSSDRSPDAIVSDGEYVVFSGGYTTYGDTPSKRIDIYHVPTRTWSQVDMQTERFGSTVALIHKKVVIAGGIRDYSYPTGDIEIYDLQSATWTRAQLSEPRAETTLINDGEKLYFGGGVVNPDPIAPDTVAFSKKIDVYDAASGQWSTSNLSRGKYLMNGIAFKGKNYWAGGINNQAIPEFRLEVADPVSNSITFDCMENPGYSPLQNGLMAAVKDNQSICFISDRSLSLYEPVTKTWSAASLPSGGVLGIVHIQTKLYLVNLSQTNTITISQIQF